MVGDRTQEPAEEEAPGLQLVGDRTQEPAEEEAPEFRTDPSPQLTGTTWS